MLSISLCELEHLVPSHGCTVVTDNLEPVFCLSEKCATEWIPLVVDLNPASEEL